MNKRKYKTNPVLLLKRADDCLGWYPESRFCLKIFCVKLVIQGIPVKKVAEIAGVSDKTIDDWVRTADEKGFSSLREKYSGRHHVIPYQQAIALFESYQSESPETYGEAKWNAKAIMKYANDEFGISISVRTAYNLLREFKEYSAYLQEEGADI